MTHIAKWGTNWQLYWRLSSSGNFGEHGLDLRQKLNVLPPILGIEDSPVYITGPIWLLHLVPEWKMAFWMGRPAVGSWQMEEEDL